VFKPRENGLSCLGSQLVRARLIVDETIARARGYGYIILVLTRFGQECWEWWYFTLFFARVVVPSFCCMKIKKVRIK